MKNRRVRLVDTTLRDGSHAVRHSFDTKQVKKIAKGLDKSGIELIEISHGDGLGGSSFNYGFSTTDELKLIEAGEDGGDVRLTVKNVSELTITSITAEVTRATAAEGSLSTRIAQTAESITSEVTRAKGVENTLGSQTLGSQEDDVAYIWQNAWHPRTRTVDMRLSIFVRGEDGRYERLEEVQRQRAYGREELTRCLTEAGFAGIRFYGDRTLRAPTAKEARWHVTAMRPKEK